MQFTESEKFKSQACMRPNLGQKNKNKMTKHYQYVHRFTVIVRSVSSDITVYLFSKMNFVKQRKVLRIILDGNSSQRWSHNTALKKRTDLNATAVVRILFSVRTRKGLSLGDTLLCVCKSVRVYVCMCVCEFVRYITTPSTAQIIQCVW